MGGGLRRHSVKTPQVEGNRKTALRQRASARRVDVEDITRDRPVGRPAPHGYPAPDRPGLAGPMVVTAHLHLAVVEVGGARLVFGVLRPSRSARYRPAITPGVNTTDSGSLSGSGHAGGFQRPRRSRAARHADSSAMTWRRSHPAIAGESPKMRRPRAGAGRDCALRRTGSQSGRRSLAPVLRRRFP